MKTEYDLRACALVLALAGALTGFAATGPQAAPGDPATGSPESFFGLTNLYTFHLTIAPDQWAIMEQVDGAQGNAQPPAGGNERPGRFPLRPARGGVGRGPGAGPGRDGPPLGIEFKKGTATLEFQDRPMGAIRVRFKGNSSYRFARNGLKRSLKLDFNDLEKGRTFFGFTKLNLNNNAMDPSQLREALAYDIFRAGGVPAGRTAFAKVFLTVPGQHNHAYAGLFTVVEQVDERFLKARFGTKAGLLLKPEHLPGLPYWGHDWAAYTNRVQAKTAVTAADAQRFMDFTQCLNRAPDARFQAVVAEYVEVDEFLRFLALQGLLANLDSPLLTGHNFYLYLHPQTRQFLWLPWDLNEAFGCFPPGGSAREQMDLSVDHPFTRVNYLAERLLQAPALKDRYHQIVRGLLATNFSTARLFPLIEAMTATIRSAAASDRMIPPGQFEAAVADSNLSAALLGEADGRTEFGRGGPGGPRRSPPPLKTFIRQRIASATLQLAGRTNGYVPREIRPGGGPSRGGGPGGPNPPPGFW